MGVRRQGKGQGQGHRKGKGKITSVSFRQPLAAEAYMKMLEWITIYSSVRIHFHVSVIGIRGHMGHLKDILGTY